MSKWDKLLKRITSPKHEPIKKVYIEMVKAIVESGTKDCENDR